MKKLLLISTLIVLSLSACYVVPIGDHEGGFRGDRDHREDGDRRGNRDDRGDEHGGRDGSR